MTHANPSELFMRQRLNALTRSLPGAQQGNPQPLRRATPCELYLVRHAIAAERGEDWPDDDKRPLTTRGVALFTEAVQGLSRLDVAVDEIFTSPLIRAKQTAELLAAHLIGASRALPFKKGGVCRIDVESLTSRRAGALSWFVTPKLLRELSQK